VVHTATATLARLRSAAQALRVESEAEALARDAAERLGVTAPRLVWSSDLLAVPVMEKRDGG
jgi:hypothetical protein